MKEDELAKTLKQHAETINTLNKNQQVLVKAVEDIKKDADVTARVDEIIKQTQATTKAAEAQAATDAAAAVARAASAAAIPPPATSPPTAPPAEPEPATPAKPAKEGE